MAMLHSIYQLPRRVAPNESRVLVGFASSPDDLDVYRASSDFIVVDQDVPEHEPTVSEVPDQVPHPAP